MSVHTFTTDLRTGLRDDHIILAGDREPSWLRRAAANAPILAAIRAERAAAAAANERGPSAHGRKFTPGQTAA
jgi:hypothetical protein